MSALFRNTGLFALIYCVLLVPTYVLPWMGSNSAVVNAVGAAAGLGMTPQWWLHAWSLTMLVVLTWGRGRFVGKNFLPWLSFVAATFDLVPGLSMIPFVPSFFHLAALYIGVKSEANDSDDFSAVSRRMSVVAGSSTILAVLGIVTFMSTLGSNAKTVKENAAKNLPASQALPATKMTPSDQLPPVADIKPSQVVTDGASSKKDVRPQTETPQAAKEPAVAAGGAEVKKKQNSAPRVRYININE